MPRFKRRHLERAAQKQHFPFPKRIHLRGPVTTGPHAARAALVYGAGRELALKMTEGTLAAFPQDRFVCQSKPILQPLGQCHRAITRDELIERHLLGGDRVEAVVGPLSIAQVHEHVPVVVLIASAIVQGGQPVDGIPRAAGVTRLNLGRSQLMQSSPVATDIFGDQFPGDNRRNRLAQRRSKPAGIGF